MLHDIKNDILKLVKNKRSGTTGAGEKIYSHTTDADLEKIIAASIMSVVNKIQNSVDIACDENETVVCVQQDLDTLKTEFESKKTNLNLF